jgi:hypothetical protein
MTAPFNPLAALAFCWRKIGAQAASIALVFSMLSGMSTQAYAQANGAQFVAQSVPAVMVAGQSYSVSVTMKNTGTKSWTAAAMYRLGAVNPQNSRTWLQDARAHINPATTVAPGAQYTFAFNVSAPSAAGTYNFQWQMLLEFVEWFGATTPNVAVVVNPPKPNQAKFISQSVPGAMTAGNSYDVSVTFKNTGTVTWTSATDFKLGAQNPQDNEVWIKRVNLPGSVAPGQDAIFRFTVRAPATNGSYDFQWRMLREFVEWFGDYSPNAPVTVSGGTQPATTFFHNDVAGTPMMATGTDGKLDESSVVRRQAV